MTKYMTCLIGLSEGMVWHQNCNREVSAFTTGWMGKLFTSCSPHHQTV